MVNGVQKDERRAKAILALLLSSPFFLNMLLNGFYQRELSRHPPWFWAVDILAFVICPIVTLYLLKQYCGISARDLGFVISKPTQLKPTPLMDMMVSSIVATILFLIIWFVGKNWLWYWLWPWLWTYNWDAIEFSYKAMGHAGLTFLTVPYLAATAALAEEMYFRGLLYYVAGTLLPAKWLIVTYVFVSGIAFGIIHWEQGLVNVIGTTLLGWVAARLYISLKSLWPLVIAHFVTNFLSFS